jgi:hypothetical protein
MQALVKSGDLPRATALIEKLLELKDKNLLLVGPGCRTIASLVYFWKTSAFHNRISQVEKFEKRLDMMAQRDGYLCNTVVKFS